MWWLLILMWIGPNVAYEAVFIHKASGLCWHVDDQQNVTLSNVCDTLLVWTEFVFLDRIVHGDSGYCVSVMKKSDMEYLGLDSSCTEVINEFRIDKGMVLHKGSGKCVHPEAELEGAKLELSYNCSNANTTTFIFQRVPEFGLLSAPGKYFVSPTDTFSYEYFAVIPVGSSITDIFVTSTCRDCSESIVNRDRNDLEVNNSTLLPCNKPEAECSNLKYTWANSQTRFADDSMTCAVRSSFVAEQVNKESSANNRFRHQSTFTVTRPALRKEGDLISPMLYIQIAQEFFWVFQPWLAESLDDSISGKLQVSITTATDYDYAGSNTGIILTLDNIGLTDVRNITSTVYLPQYAALDQSQNWPNDLFSGRSPFLTLHEDGVRKTITMKVPYVDPAHPMRFRFSWVTSYRILKGISKDTPLPIYLLVTYCSHPCNGTILSFVTTHYATIRPLPQRDIPRDHFRIQNRMSGRCLAVGSANQLYVSSNCDATYGQSENGALIDRTSGRTLFQPGTNRIAEYMIDYDGNFLERTPFFVNCYHESFVERILGTGYPITVNTFPRNKGCQRYLMKGRYLHAWNRSDSIQTRTISEFNTVALGKVWIICNPRGNLGDRHNCYLSWKNFSWIGLDSSITNVMFLHPSPEAIYGTRNKGKEYFKMELSKYPKMDCISPAAFSTKRSEAVVTVSQSIRDQTYPEFYQSKSGFNSSSVMVYFLSDGRVFMWDE